MKKINLNPKLIKLLSVSIGLTLLSSTACNKEIPEEPKIVEATNHIVEDGSLYNYVYVYNVKTDINGRTIDNYAYDKVDNQNYHDIRIKYNNLINESKDIREIKTLLEEFKQEMDDNAFRAVTKYYNANSYYNENSDYLHELYDTYQDLDVTKVPENGQSIYKAIYNADNYSVVISNNVAIVGNDGFFIHINESESLFSDFQYERLGEVGMFVLKTKEENQAYLDMVNSYEPIVLTEEELSKLHSQKKVK